MWDTFFEQAIRWHAEGEPFALATVVACQRPTAAYPGAKALIRADGTLTGWVGGSCAQPTVRDNRPGRWGEIYVHIRWEDLSLLRLGCKERFDLEPERYSVLSSGGRG